MMTYRSKTNALCEGRQYSRLSGELRPLKGKQGDWNTVQLQDPVASVRVEQHRGGGGKEMEGRNTLENRVLAAPRTTQPEPTGVPIALFTRAFVLLGPDKSSAAGQSKREDIGSGVCG